MIDIIIPAYNAHNTIEHTLHSIAMQVNKNKLHVIIVNDGGKDYNDIVQKFTQWLDIKEIACPKNCGPGYARNYGIQNSNSKYIMFMDADDGLAYAYILPLLLDIIESNNANIITSKVLEVYKILNTESYALAELQPNMRWLFGNLYRREFLEKYNIHFLTTCHSEDTGFNTICLLLSDYDNKENGIISFCGSPPTYEWKWKDGSLSRSELNDNIKREQISILGYIYSQLKAFEFAEVQQKNTITSELAIDGLMVTLFTLYQYQNVFLNQENLLSKIQKDMGCLIEEIGRYFYYKYYNLVSEAIPPDVLQNELINFINNQMEDTQILKISFSDFINFIFSKPSIEDFNSLDIESKLFQSKEY